jgi:enoyl-CoA hydratase
MGTPSVTASGTAVRVADAGPGIVTVTLNRPPVNALSTDAYQQVRDAFTELSGRDETKVVVLRSELDRVFCAGADLNELRAIAEGQALISVCDIRLGTPRASIVLPEINVGRCGGARHDARKGR